MIKKEDLKTQLKQNIGNIKFEKKDKSIRNMTCTLHEKFLPSRDIKEISTSKKAENPEVVSVWDIDKQAWRSFRLDSIVEYSFETI